MLLLKLTKPTSTTNLITFIWLEYFFSFYCVKVTQSFDILIVTRLRFWNIFALTALYELDDPDYWNSSLLFY